MSMDEHYDAELEARLRAGLAAGAATTEISPAGLDAIHRRIRVGRARRAGVTVLVAVALIALGAGVVVGIDSARPLEVVDDGSDTGTGAPLPRLVPRWVPGGFELTIVRDFDSDADFFRDVSDALPPMPQVQLYQSAGARSPLDDPVVMLMDFPDVGNSIEEIASTAQGPATMTEVDGRPAVLMHVGSSVGVALVHDDGGSTLVAARGLDEQTVLALAADIEPSADGSGHQLASPPDGLELIYSGVIPFPGSGTDDGYTLHYGKDSGERFAITVQRSDVRGELLFATIGVLDQQEVPLRGTAAVAGTPQQPNPGFLPENVRDGVPDVLRDAVILTWAERSDVLVQVTAAGVTLPDVVRLAASLEEASEEEWREIAEVGDGRASRTFTSLEPATEPPLDTYIHVLTVVEEDLRLTLTAGLDGGTLCTDLASDGGASFKWCGPSPEDAWDPSTTTLDSIEGRPTLVVAADAAVAVVRIEIEGRVVEQQVTRAEIGARTFSFAVIVLPEDVPRRGLVIVTFVGEDGRDLYSHPYPVPDP